MQNRVKHIGIILPVLLSILVCACQKRELDDPVIYDDAEYILGGLVNTDRSDGVLRPIRGRFTGEGELTVPVASFDEAQELFLSLLPPYAEASITGDRIAYKLTDGQDAAQGEAVFTKDAEGGARLTLPAACNPVRVVLFASPQDMLLEAVDPDVKEDLEDNYYYGAIVNIADHGCGSGKFVVLREYNFDNGAAGMAIRLDSRRWHTSEMSQGSTEHDIAARASCLSTMRTAGAIIRSDWNVITKQLTNAGSIIPDQHFYSADRQWTGLHYYYCFHDEETDTIGPFNDLEFYEAWIYWFQPSGNSIYFW